MRLTLFVFVFVLLRQVGSGPQVLGLAKQALGLARRAGG